MKHYLSPWQCDSDVDYYNQFADADDTDSYDYSDDTDSYADDNFIPLLLEERGLV